MIVINKSKSRKKRRDFLRRTPKVKKKSRDQVRSTNPLCKIQVTTYKPNLIEFRRLRYQTIELVGVPLVPTESTIYALMKDCVLNPQHLWNPR